MATATMRLLRPLVTDHHQPPFIIRCCWASGVCSSSSKPRPGPGGAKAAAEKSKRRGKKKIGAADEHHLKRRTRSGAAFDRALYSRYASQHSDGGHVPVMLGEVLQAFSLPLTSFVDCTLGAAGHASAIIQAHPEMRLFLGLDMDPVAHNRAKTRIEALLGSSEKHGLLTAYTHVRNYKYIKSVLAGIDDNILNNGVDGIFMDLGMSSMQVNHSDRGFSLLTDGPLDMRMDPQASLNAKEILNFWPEAEVGRVLRDYGEESNWRFLQRKIVNARKNGGLHSTSELVDLVRSTSANSGGRQGWIKTATRVFQALRIAVNDELQTLEDSLYACFDCLAPGGRLAVISFHSLEDRIVKQSFLDLIIERGSDNSGRVEKNSIDHLREEEDEIGGEEEGAWMKQVLQGSNGSILTKRPITPTEEEERLNRRCRSAKLRVLQKSSVLTNSLCLSAC